MHSKKTTYNLSDEEIIELAQSGDEDAVEIIMYRYKNLVYFCSSKYYMQGMDKDDILQEGMIGLYKAIMDFKPGKTSFKSFASLCITRKLISLLKASNRKKHTPLNASISLDNESICEDYSILDNNINTSLLYNPESILINRETFSDYENKIKQELTALELSVFNCHINGMTYEEISKHLDKNMKSVDNAVQRAKRKLASMLINKI